MKKTTGATALFVAAVLLVGLQPQPVAGFGGGIGAGLSTAAPIGAVESLGTTQIGQRMAHGRTALWAGETIRAFETNANIAINDAGKIVLAKGAEARFAMNAGPTLVVSLLAGEIIVDLNQTTAAYVEVSGSAVSGSRGSAFRVGLRDYRPTLERLRGEAWVEQQPAAQRRYRVRPVGLGSSI